MSEQEVKTKSDEDKIVDYINDNQNEFVATHEGYPMFVEADGVKVQLYLNTIGYRGTYEVSFNRYKDSQCVNRVTAGKEAFVNMKQFKESARYQIDAKLTEDITRPATIKSQKNTAKSLDGWIQENATLIKHGTIVEVKSSEHGYSEKVPTHVGTDKLVTEVKAYSQDKYPNIRQIFGIVHKSGIEVDHVDHNKIFVIGNGEQTTKFLELLNDPFKWYE